MKLIIPLFVLCLMATMNAKAQSSLDMNKEVENQDLESNKLDNPVVLFQKTKQDKTLYFYVYEESDKKDYVAFETVVETADRTYVLSRLYIDSYDDKRYFYNIIDFAVYESYIYILYSGHGYIFMDQYQQGEDGFVVVERFPIGSFVTISADNGGILMSRGESKWIDNNLYFYINAMQSAGPDIFDSLLKFDRRRVFEISFSMKQAQIIKVLQIERFGINWYETYEKTGESETSDSATNKEQYAILSKFYNKPYGYWLLTGQDILDSQEEDFLRSAGLKKHSLITINEEGILSDEQLEVATKSLHHVLVTYCNRKPSSTFRIVEYIYNQYNKLYFFYNNGSAEIQIAIYNLSRDEWIIDEYEEKNELATGDYLRFLK